MGWQLEYTYNHWSNARLAAKYFDNPEAYFVTERNRLDRPQDQKGFVVQDNWGPQKGDEFRETVKENNPCVIPVQLWPNTTRKYQIIDLAGNGLMKKGTTGAAQRYVQIEARSQLRAGVPPAAVNVDLRLSTIKPKLLDWIKEGMAAVASNKNGIMAAWASAGYMDSWFPEMQRRAKDAFANGTLHIHAIPDAEDPENPHVLNIGGEDKEGNEDCLDVDSLPQVAHRREPPPEVSQPHSVAMKEDLTALLNELG